MRPGAGHRRLHDSDRRRAVGGMAAAIMLSLSFGLASGFVGGGVRTAGAAAPSGAVTGDPDVGRAIFLSTCAACHGAQAEGTANAPSLQTAGTGLIDFMMRTGRMPLPELGQPPDRRPRALTDAAISDVVAYLAPLTVGPGIPAAAVTSGDLARGRQLYTANCAACHGAAGIGDSIGGGITAPALRDSSPLDVAEAVNGGPPPMPRFALSPADLAALTAYVQYLRNPPNPGGSPVAGIGPVAEGFVAGFVGLLALVLLIVWIARTSPGAQRAPAPASDEPYEGAGRR